MGLYEVRSGIKRLPSLPTPDIVFLTIAVEVQLLRYASAPFSSSEALNHHWHLQLLLRGRNIGYNESMALSLRY